MVSQKREPCGFDLITIHPPLVIGPFLPGFAAVRTPSESSMMVAKLMTGALPILPGKGTTHSLASALAFVWWSSHAGYLARDLPRHSHG